MVLDNNTKEILHELIQSTPVILGAIATGLAGYAAAKAKGANEYASTANRKADTNTSDIVKLRNGEGTRKVEEVLAQKGIIDRRTARERLAAQKAGENVSHETPPPPAESGELSTSV